MQNSGWVRFTTNRHIGLFATLELDTLLLNQLSPAAISIWLTICCYSVFMMTLVYVICVYKPSDGGLQFCAAVFHGSLCTSSINVWTVFIERLEAHKTNNRHVHHLAQSRTLDVRTMIRAQSVRDRSATATWATKKGEITLSRVLLRAGRVKLIMTVRKLMPNFCKIYYLCVWINAKCTLHAAM